MVEAESSKMNKRAEPVPAQDRCMTWLVPQVRQLQEGAAQLRTVYAGEHAEAIASREQEVLQGWKELLAACEDARLHVSSTADALRFHSQARDLLSWMDGIAGQIGAADKPRCSLTHFRTPNNPFATGNLSGPTAPLPRTVVDAYLVSRTIVLGPAEARPELGLVAQASQPRHSGS